MSYQTLLCETRNSIGYVKINRPDKLNALNRQVMEDLFNCFQALQDDEKTRVVILSGSGEKAFAAGADIEELSALNPLQAKAFSDFGQKVFNLIENLCKPVLGVVNGFALGGGCELAMACTLRVAAETARFGQPEVKLGIIPGYGGSQRLPRLVGKGRALELILTGEPITAPEAYRIGLVNQVVPAAELMATAETLAHKIIANAPLAIKFALEAVQHGLEMPAAEGQFLEATLFGLCCSTADMKEGTRAFLEKRAPKFAGH